MLALVSGAGHTGELLGQAPAPLKLGAEPKVEASAPIELLPPTNSTLEIRVARRPWLLEKLTNPKQQPSVKMDPPRPPRELPDPPSMLKATPETGPSDGWESRLRSQPESRVETQPSPDPQPVNTAPRFVGPPSPVNRLREVEEPALPDGPAELAESAADSDAMRLEPFEPTVDTKLSPAPEAAEDNEPAAAAPREAGSARTEPQDEAEKKSEKLEEVVIRDLRINLEGTPEGEAETEAPHKGQAETASPASPSTAAPSREVPRIDTAVNTPAAKLDYTGYPLSPLRRTPSVERMRHPLRQCLRQYYSRPEIANDRSNWGMLHAIMIYGADTKILVGNKSYNAIAWIAGNNACRGQRLLAEENGRITVQSGVGLQGHQAQMLAIFSLCNVPAQYPLYAGESRFTLQDVIETEMRSCRSGQELTFTLIGLAHYLDTNATWTSEDGETWDFERLIREELAQPIVGAACGGTHRLMGYGHALRKRRAEGRPIMGQWKRAEIYTRDFMQYAYRLQNRDGSMSTDWFAGREDNGDIDRKIQTTGHIVEWLLSVTPDSGLQDQRLVNAVWFLLSTMSSEPDRDWSVGPKGHALRALAMFYERVYQSGPAWQNEAMATTRSGSRR
jgi:hypothetical protein